MTGCGAGSSPWCGARGTPCYYYDPAREVRLVMTEGALRWQARSAALMAEQLKAIADAIDRPSLRLGIIPWTQPVRFFPRHGFHIFDADSVVVGTESATATMTGAADVATYVELFVALEEIASFGDDARRELARIQADSSCSEGKGRD